MNILIVPDKFKGSLTAVQAAGAIRRGLEKVLPDVRCLELPIADGGEGTAEILCSALSGEWVTASAQDPLGRLVEAGYAWLPGSVAVIAMSAASGLWRVAVEERDLLCASTYGTGQLMADAVKRGARQILVCLGGSATNDGGVGMATALGWRFTDRDGSALKSEPRQLRSLVHIHRATDLLPEIVALCDVSNPLLGSRGATWTYGLQKGGDGPTRSLLEAGLTHLADVVHRELSVDYRNTPGAGAAGGLGFGLLSFCGAQLRPGFEIVAAAIGLEAAIVHSDLVITGEGSLDAQTLEGKGPVGIAAMARKLGKPVIAFAGCVSEPAALRGTFDGIFAIKDETMTLDTALRDAEFLLEKKAADAAIQWLGRGAAQHRIVPLAAPSIRW